MGNPGRKLTDRELQLRQIEAMERLADELAENNRLLRNSQDGPRIMEPQNPMTGDEVAELFASIPEGMFQNLNWDDDE